MKTFQSAFSFKKLQQEYPQHVLALPSADLTIDKNYKLNIHVHTHEYNYRHGGLDCDPLQSKYMRGTKVHPCALWFPNHLENIKKSTGLKRI